MQSRGADYGEDEYVSVLPSSDVEAQVRVTCPDKTGLGSDITRTIFDFGFVVLKGDFATDGKWAFVLVTVRRSGGGAGTTAPVNWDLLRIRLENLCPSKQSISTLSSLNLRAVAAGEGARDPLEPPKGTMYILQVEVEDRVGLLHDVTQELWASELTVHRAHISTSPADTAVDLFYVTDERNELPAESRVAEISRNVQRTAVRQFGESGTSIAASIMGGRHCRVTVTPAPKFVTKTSSAGRLIEANSIGKIETASATQYSEATVTVDNLMSQKHTVFQMRTRDRKGLLYDVLRASKDLKVHISYAKVELKSGGLCEVDLFVARCTNLQEQRYLCQRYKENIERPVSVQIMTMGLDEITTELRVIAPLDISGFTRPRVLLDVTEALRQLKVMVFKADIIIMNPDRSDGGIIGGGSANSSPGNSTQVGPPGATRQEVHRFLLTDARGQPISSVRDRKVICNRVLGVLLQ
jgi:ACT domain-containing protein